MKKIAQWLVDKWLAGFITASIFFILKVYIDLPSHERQSFFRFDWVHSVLVYPIQLWLVLVLVFFILLIVSIARRTTVPPKRRKVREEQYMFERLYTVDTFGVNNAKWTWDYEIGYDKLIVTNARPLCPTCESVMEISPFAYHMPTATCSKCRLERRQDHYQLQQNPEDVVDEIVRRLKSGEYEQKIQHILNPPKRNK